ncbi:MAG TPA: metallophosphoesterase, partial [Steroidobacteraceae bacterium]
MRRILIAAALFLLSAAAAGSDSEYRFEGVGRVVVFADVHGAFPQLVSALREAKVIDDSLRWSGRDTHLVGLGDLLDRGPESRKAMDLLMRLEKEAQQAGGAVHVLLGNHEVMNIVGDLRYVTAAEYSAFAGPEDAALREQVWQRVLLQDPAALRADFDSAFPSGYFAHRQAFSPAGQYGRWLSSKPFLITINGTAFVHAGLPEMVTRLGLEETNRNLHAQLDDYLRVWQLIETELNLVRPIGFQERAEAVGAAGALEHSKTLTELRDKELFSPTGPTWYRGQALCYAFAEAANLEAALAKLDVKRVVEG